MTPVESIPAGELAERLASTDVRVRLGPMVAQFGLSDPASVQVFRHLYGRHPLAAGDEVPDFTFSLQRTRLSRWRRGEYGSILLDGVPLTRPFEWQYSWPMFEWGLHIAVSKRGGFALMLHAAVVARGGRALVLPAASGSGKSTLCALLIAAGWDFVSDEFLVLRRTGRGLVINPLPQPVALKGESLGIAGPLFPGQDWGGVWPHASKGTIRYLRPPMIDPGAELSPGWIVLPRFVSGASTAFTPVPPGEVFMAVGPNAFTYHWRGADGFRDAAELVRSSSCARLEFGDGHEAVAALDSWTAAG